MGPLNKLYYRTLKPALPQNIMIEPTNACTLKCHMCDYQKQFKGERSCLSFSDFESIIAQFPDIAGLVFCGIGEPLLNQDITKMISAAAKRKIPFINLITNGTLLDEVRFKSLVNAGLTRLHISFHSLNSEIASKTNGVNAEVHNVVRNNIVNATKLRDALCSNLYIVINCVMNVENYDDILNLIDFCETNKINEINLAQLTTIFGKYDNFNIRRAQARDLLRNIKIRVKNSRVKVKFVSGSDVGRCYQLWNFIMIHADGNLSPCNGIMPHENKNIGNLIRDNISRIWHSDKYIELRRSVMNGCLENCKYCASGYLLEGKNFKWLKNCYLKPLARSLYRYVRYG